MSKCANCGTELAPGMKFCCECGSPVPQTKICPNCGTELMPSAKFCFNCGTSLNGVQASGATGATVGGHAVVAGDVTSNVTNTTYVTNADETRYVVSCHVCGKSLTIVETFNCPVCHRPTCAQHYDEGHKMCVVCRDKWCHDAEESFRQTIREELTAGGGRLTQEALVRLRQRRIALGLEENRGRELIAAERRAGEQTLGAKLTETQRILLDKAMQLVFNDGKCVEAVAEIDRILRGGVAMTDEIRTVMLPALLVCDEKRGDEIADRTLEDSLPVAFYRIDRALMHGDLPTAERALTEAERIWPDDIQLKSRRIVFTCALYDESEDENYSDKAAELFDALPQENDDEVEKDPLTASWRLYASNRVDLVLGDDDEIQSLDEDDNRYEALVYGRLTEPCGGPMRKRRAEMLYDEGCDFCNEETWEDAVGCFREAAEVGHARAQCWIGILYYKGHGVPQAYEEAAKWYRKAAEQGEQYAQCNLASLYENGHGVAQSYEEAVKWYRKAAAQGNVDAQCNLGWMYESGHGVAQSDAEAVVWYRKAAEQGQARAQCNLGWMYESGRGVSQSDAEAVRWYRRSADQGNANAQCNLGWMYESGRGVSQSDAEAVKWYRKSAEQGHARAQGNLAVMYFNGRGVPQSYEESVRWLRKAAEQGDVKAQNNLGIAYQNGCGVAQSFADAAIWLRKASEQGDMDAQASLGVLYFHGQGVPQSYEEALKWLRGPAAAGNANAQKNIGIMYLRGLGVPQSCETAVKWFWDSAKQGNAGGQLCLGAAYVNGQGVPRDFERGISLIQQAARQGEAQAKDALRQFGRSW